MNRIGDRLLIGTIALAVAACGGSSTPSPTGTGSTTHLVAGVARVLHGASAGAAGSLNPPARAAASAAATDTVHWAISPDQGKVTILTLTFKDAGGTSPQQVSLTNCVATYTRANQSLSPILDCPFQVPAGNYVGLDVGIASTFQVLINDAVNGFFSSPGSSTGISRTIPAGGALSSSFTVASSGGTGGVITVSTFFASPLIVDSAAPPTVSLVVDMIHTVFVNVIGGVVSFDTSLPLPAVQIVPSMSGVGRAEFYTASGTALNVVMPGSTDDDSRSVRVFYAALPQPAYLFSPVVGPSQAWNVSPATSPSGRSGFRAGGYLGIDASGLLCWALPMDYTYAQYHQLRRMQIVTTLGAPTTVAIKVASTAPAPTSGNTYASGCPAFTADSTFTVYLVAR